MLQFDPNQKAPAPRAASTVIALRNTQHAIEVFCVLRHQKSSFLGGAVVFPGGKVDADDADETWKTLSTEPHPRTALMESADASALALTVAAARESLEEAALLPATQNLSAADLLALRTELSSSAFRGVVAAHKLRLAAHALLPWARWVTPQAESRRFDARFFLLPLPEGQEGVHDNHETTMSFWSRPSDVLDRFMKGEIFLAPPTCRTLELLAACNSVESAVLLADRQSLLPICPTFVPHDTAPFLSLPGDPTHEVPEKRVDGKTRFVLRNGRFVSEDPT
ncbi:MAG: hypothetical protein IPK82_33960 [Polyangiaceae bacterium]|nr:hypothetical protein [Polyangiaceae bacterium]